MSIGRARKTRLEKWQEAASKILRAVGHTMSLEAQGTTEKELQKEIERIARELKESGDSRIWSDDKIKPKGVK